jgi:hypothetical protein
MAIAPKMVARGGGTIINVTTMAAESHSRLDPAALWSSRARCSGSARLAVRRDFACCAANDAPSTDRAPRHQPGTQGARFGTHFRPQIVRIRLD